MKNQRGSFLSVMFIAAMLLFAMGPINGNTAFSERNPVVYSMNAPPGHVVVAAVENQNFPVYELSMTDILIARGVSVPYLGLIMSDNNYSYTQINNCQICLDNRGESTLGLRSASKITKVFLLTNSLNNSNLPIQKSRQINRLRGVNTRLDIGELFPQAGVLARHI
jgi:hypothetical protein